MQNGTPADPETSAPRPQAPDGDRTDDAGHDQAVPTGTADDSPVLVALMARVSEENGMRRAIRSGTPGMPK
ncbi:hypothetical protein ACF1CG_17735 [Streptomyces sp. NPDC014773]|uniref:hypothetical protein n=1 Tax=Streptomyces sp. NPDC014773 TaxID=3364908 RepID=UPI0036FBA909